MMEWTGERNVLDLRRAVCYIADSSRLQRLVEGRLVSHAELFGVVLHARVVDHPVRRPACGLAVSRLMVFLECGRAMRQERSSHELPDRWK
jgi:hypothetical protein